MGLHPLRKGGVWPCCGSDHHNSFDGASTYLCSLEAVAFKLQNMTGGIILQAHLSALFDVKK